MRVYMNNHSDPKDSVAWDIRHWIRIPALNHQADAITINNALAKLPGILQVQVYLERKKIRVEYDQTKVDFLLLKNQLEAVGFPLSDSWWWRRKWSWFQYLDVNARENANAPAPPCCSNPKGINAASRRQR